MCSSLNANLWKVSSIKSFLCEKRAHSTLLSLQNSRQLQLTLQQTHPLLGRRRRCQKASPAIPHSVINKINSLISILLILQEHWKTLLGKHFRKLPTAMQTASVWTRGLHAGGMHPQKTSLWVFSHNLKKMLGREAGSGSKIGIIEANYNCTELVKVLGVE